MMRYLIYKITNRINGKYYIGRHATDNVNDDYMGSGVAIRNAIEKYGREHFVKEIIAEADSREKLWELEKEIINDSVVKDDKSYNMAYGGKHYLDGLKKYNMDAFIEHQRNAGRIGGKVSIATRDSSWHAKGGASASRKKSSLYKYILTTANGEVFNLDGNSLKAMCREKGWNYDTLIWTRHKNRPVMSGPMKGFRLDQISKPNRVTRGK